VIAVVVVTDGRDYLPATLDAAIERLGVCDGTANGDTWILVDDSGAGTTRHPVFDHVIEHPERRGLAGAVQSGWTAALGLGADFVFHLEDDFHLETLVPVISMAHILDSHPYLCNMVLPRQPWSPEEAEKGTYLASFPTAVEHHEDGHTWLEHRQIFSLNPSLIPRRTLELGWPAGNEAEMTEMLGVFPERRFGFWGSRADPPWVRHVGTYRAAGWKL
jgi:hypothetical protein